MNNGGMKMAALTITGTDEIRGRGEKSRYSIRGHLDSPGLVGGSHGCFHSCTCFHHQTGERERERQIERESEMRKQ